MSKCDFRPKLNDKIGYRMSKCDMWPIFEGKNRITNVKMRYSARIRTVSTGIRIVKMRVSNVKRDIWPKFECQNRISNFKMSQPEFKVKNEIFGPTFSAGQNRISNQILYSALVRMSKLYLECQNVIFGPVRISK